MKTLFLLGILVALATIAIKKPNQTVWEAAQELGDITQTLVSDDENTTSQTLPLSNELVNTISKEAKFKKANNQNTSVQPISNDAKSIKVTPKHLAPNKQQEAALPKLNSSLPVVEKPSEQRRVASRNSDVNWPKIPAIPITPVQAVPIDEPVHSQSTTMAQASPRTDYADVKVYYENASRLLDEIK